MMRIQLISLLFLIFFACREDCSNFSSPSDSCETQTLVICDSSSFDFQEYVIRRDESYLIGSASAIKSVFLKGDTEWIANNRISGYAGDNFYLSLANYVDTSWIGLEYWANLRDVILIKFDPFQQGRQLIYGQSKFDTDSTKHYSRYIKWSDDQIDAKWEIDESKNNFILITSLDTITQIVEGEFDLSFTITNQSSLHSIEYSDKQRFRCGLFRAQINYY